MEEQPLPYSPSIAPYPSEFSPSSDLLLLDEDDDTGEITRAPGISARLSHPDIQDRSSGTGKESDPFTFDEDADAELSPLVLRYRGYLKAEHDVRLDDVQRLQEGREICDRMIDFLLAHAHAVQYEPRRSALSRVIILPTAFGECLVSLVKSSGGCMDDRPLELMMKRLSMYTLDEIWRATLLLAPIQISQHWVLVAVTNPCQAISQQESRSGAHHVLPGEMKPDREPFAVLLLNSAPLYAPKDITMLPGQMRKFLEFSWRKLNSDPLEFVNWFPVKCPEQFDSISCGLHVIHNAEVLMQEGAAERIRKTAQQVIRISPSEWRALFRPAIMQGETYRDLKLAIVRQENAVYQEGL